jgi:hypothetical protein
MNGLIVYSAGNKTKHNLLRRLMKLAEGGLHGLMILSMLVPNLSALFVIASGEENLKGVPSVDVQMLKGTSEPFGKPASLAIPRKSLGISELAAGNLTGIEPSHTPTAELLPQPSPTSTPTEPSGTPDPGEIEPTGTPTTAPAPRITAVGSATVQPTSTGTDTSTPTFETPTPSATATGTQASTDTPSATASASSTPTEQGILMEPNLGVNHNPPQAAAGDVVTTTWDLQNWPNPLDGLELALVLPEGFNVLDLEGGEYNGETRTLTVPLTITVGSLVWYIEAGAPSPYTFQATVLRYGQTILSRTFDLAKRGPFQIDAGGGAAFAFNQRVHANFPAGSLPEPVLVEMAPPLPEAAPTSFLGGLPFEAKAISVQSGEEVHQFLEPITIEVSYDESKVEGSEDMLTLFYYDEVIQTWRPLTTTVDTEANILYAQTSHFSYFDYKAQNWEAARLPTVANFQVAGFTGAGSYSYPIQAPPGPAGMQPSLALSYNSQVADGASSRGQALMGGHGLVAGHGLHTPQYERYAGIPG